MTRAIAGDTPYAFRVPDVVLDAVEAAGFVPDGRLLALPSYENRVYQVGVEAGLPLVAKFCSARALERSGDRRGARSPANSQMPNCRSSRRSTLPAARCSNPEDSGTPCIRVGGRAPELESADHLAVDGGWPVCTASYSRRRSAARDRSMPTRWCAPRRAPRLHPGSS
ncbi:MAG: hypothetical protein U1F23_01270 [Lysobacterales bacterium]